MVAIYNDYEMSGVVDWQREGMTHHRDKRVAGVCHTIRLAATAA